MKERACFYVYLDLGRRDGHYLYTCMTKCKMAICV